MKFLTEHYENGRWVAAKAKVAVLAVCGLMLSASNIPAKAGDISVEESMTYPVLFIYQNSKGNWSGCGPAQCLLTFWESREKAMDLLDSDRHRPWDFEFEHGRCQFFSGAVGSLRSYDNSPVWIVQRHHDKC